MGAHAGTLWVLNLDAELELAHRGKGAYRPSARVAALVRAHRGRLIALLPPEHRVLDESHAPGAFIGYRGRAYCPTPTAVAALEQAGATPDPAPPLEVLRRVNDRAFVCELGATLPSQAFVRSEAGLDACLREAEEIAGGFLLKRRWSMAGRGQRRVARGLDESDRRFVRAALREDGGLLVEPFAGISLECAIHGDLGVDGALAIGAPCVQEVDSRRAFVSARRATDELTHDEVRALRAAAETAGAALRAAGYFGLFGVDAFRYETPGGEPAFRAMSELNARMTMALPIGLGIPR